MKAPGFRLSETEKEGKENKGKHGMKKRKQARKNSHPDKMMLQTELRA